MTRLGAIGVAGVDSVGWASGVACGLLRASVRQALVALCLILLACGGGGDPVSPPSSPPPAPPPPPPPPQPPPPPTPTYDVDALGIPRFAASSHLDLSMIARVSRFRSAVGHDYKDTFESCRSMKHYFFPRSALDWSTLPIHSPVTGTITLTRVEAPLGIQVHVRPTAQPAFVFILFHVNPTIPVTVGTAVTAGQQIGWHVGNQTMTDIAVGVDTPTGYKLLSWFEVMTDGLFAAYQARGVASRGAAIISRAERDANPLTCAGEAFTSTGTLPDWIDLP